MKENILKPLRTYGRSKGKPLSPNQKLLMKKEYPKIDISKLVIEAKNPLINIKGEVWLEIGFGAGEHLADQAQRHPEIGFIGCEPYINGVARLLSEIKQKSLNNILLNSIG